MAPLSTAHESEHRARTLQPNEKTELSGTALAFLIPLFLFFIFGPITLIVIVKKRRGESDPSVVRSRRGITRQRVKIGRDEARKVLRECTEVRGNTCGSDDGRKGASGEGDAGSVLERECAICLSTLYEPSPVPPAKLADGGGRADSENESPEGEQGPNGEQESGFGSDEILRLNACYHEFHAECLTGWFIFGKFSCPVCRAVFYEELKDEEKKEGGGGLEASVQTVGRTSEPQTEQSTGESGRRDERREQV